MGCSIVVVPFLTLKAEIKIYVAVPEFLLVRLPSAKDAALSVRIYIVYEKYIVHFVKPV